jgi:cyclic beta-1,2-glucan synthetase
MYRLIVESLMGLHLEVDKLRIKPTLPEAWDSFRLHYRYRETFYHLVITQHTADVGTERMILDGQLLNTDHLPLVDDGQDHKVEIYLHKR